LAFELCDLRLESQRDQALAELSALRSGARPEEIAALEAAVDSAQAQVDVAREQTERTRSLAAREVVSAAQLEQEEGNLRVAEANLQAQLEQLAIGRAGGRPEDVEAAEAALRGLETQIQNAWNNLEDATLRAPFSGIIARRDIENFTNIQAGQSVVLLQELAIVDLAFDVPGPDVTALTANGPDNITNQVVFDALPGQVFDAELAEFSTQADAATQTYRGRVSVVVPEGVFILPGMVGRVITSAPTNGAKVMRIPVTAVAAKPDGSTFVWLLDPAANTVSPRDVTLGQASGAQVAVVAGLEAGDIIVSAGVSQLQDGMKIRPITKIGG
ncbi:MAG: efflux RND transporter periplasmic adaptor subunit, partial [Pseudomonadota bacterium]